VPGLRPSRSEPAQTIATLAQAPVTRQAEQPGWPGVGATIDFAASGSC